MAVLDALNRLLVRVAFMYELMVLHETLGLTKAELLAAVGALDDFMNTNAAAVNTAIPQPARGVLTTVQKARLLNYVIRQRYIAGV